MACELLAEQNGHHTSISYDMVDDVIEYFYVMITQTKDNHHSGSWINFRIIEDGQIRLKLMIEKLYINRYG